MLGKYVLQFVLLWLDLHECVFRCGANLFVRNIKTLICHLTRQILHRSATQPWPTDYHLPVWLTAGDRLAVQRLAVAAGISHFGTDIGFEFFPCPPNDTAANTPNLARLTNRTVAICARSAHQCGASCRRRSPRSKCRALNFRGPRSGKLLQFRDLRCCLRRLQTGGGYVSATS